MVVDTEKKYRLIFKRGDGTEFESQFTLRPKTIDAILLYLRDPHKPWFMYPTMWRLVEA